MINDINPQGIELSDAELEAAAGGERVPVGTYDPYRMECRVDGYIEKRPPKKDPRFIEV